MQKFKITLLVVMAIVWACPVFAQDSGDKLWMATEITVKSDQVANFEKSLVEVAKLFKEQDYEYSWSVFQSTGLKYYYFMEMENLADFDKIAASSNEAWTKIDPAVLDNYLNCIQSYKRFTINSLNEYSYFPENPRMGMDEMNYAIWDVHYIKPGKEKEYFESLKNDFLPKVNEYKYGDPILFLQGGIGTEAPMYIGVLYGKSDVDFLQENKKMWDAFGEEGDKMYQKFISMLRDRDKIEFWFRRDLSYTSE